MRQGRRSRTAILSSIGAVAVLVLGQGVALAAEGSATLDDPIGTVTDAVDDPIGIVTDAVDDTTGAVGDTVDDTTGAVGDTVDDLGGTVTDTVEETTDTIAGTVEGAVAPVVAAAKGTTGADPVQGTDPGTADSVGGSETASSPASSMGRGRVGTLDARASVAPRSDLDELAQGGNEVVAGPGQDTCVGIADVVCLDLVGGLGALGILFRAVEEARDVVSAFTDALAGTGSDLLRSTVMLVILMLTGIALTSRRQHPSAQPAKGRPPIART